MHENGIETGETKHKSTMGSRDETSSTLVLETSAVVTERQHETWETDDGDEEAEIEANAGVDDGEKAVKIVA